MLCRTLHAILLVGAAALLGCDGDAPASAAPSAVERYSVVVVEAGDRKIQAIKAVREVTGLGLKDAKDLVDNVPSVVRRDQTQADALALADTLSSAGMAVEIRRQ